LRLRGDVGGVERSFPVPEGVSRIGSVSGNEIVLPVRGVSRRHAVLRHDGERLSVEDEGSKNGVFVNGSRIKGARLLPGDVVGFGPVLLKLDQVPLDDAELALVVDGPSGPREGLPSWETTATQEHAVRAAWLRLVDGFLARLCVTPEPDLAGGLDLALEALGASGACALEWSQGEALVLAARGAVPALAEDAGLREALDELAAGRASGRAAFLALDEAPVVTCGLLAGVDRVALGIVLWGDFPGRGESEPLLAALVRVLARFRPRAVHDLHGEAPMPPRGLQFPPGYLPGRSPAMASLHGQIRLLLQGDLPVLLVGETGVGKEYVARMLHTSSARGPGPFVAVNCAAIPSELLEAEMFGIGKGVATGVTERRGKFQLAEGGTLFLDEVGETPLDLQAKLLRALQEKEIQPVGGSPLPVNIRVVTATNADLQRRMEEGRFRRDLYYRIAGYALRIPALRERREDIPVLVEGFVRGFARETGKSVRGITVRALRTLSEYPWPGNVRELEHEVRRLVYMCPDGDAIDSTMLSGHIGAPGAEPAEPAGEASLDLEPRVQQLEEKLIRQALARAGGNRTVAAKLLGVSRNGLAIKMRRLGIEE
jgi:transcriptional regulator with AAA-type ATPase domain